MGSRRSALNRSTMKILWILAACVAVAAAAPKNDDDDESVRCRKVQIPDGVCAILYDDQNCRDRALIGWSEELKEGEKTLGLLHKNDAESVLVKAGCTFRGYDNTDGWRSLIGIADGEDKVAERGDSIAVVADGGKNKAVTFEDSDRGVEEKLDDNIEYVSCRCGNQGSCAPAYDKPKCGLGGGLTEVGWGKPLEIGEVKEINLSYWSYFKQRNDIEPVSVRKGCVFEGYDNTDRKGQKITIAATTSDKHMDITGSLKNEISSMSCICGAS